MTPEATFIAELLVDATPRGMVRAIDRPLLVRLLASCLDRMAVDVVAREGLRAMATEEGWTECCGGTGEVLHGHPNDPHAAREPCPECCGEVFDVLKGCR